MNHKRTDIHREGAMIPSEYRYVLSYALETYHQGIPIPSFGLNCERELRRVNEQGALVAGQHKPGGRCCLAALRESGVPWASHGSTGTCTACSTPFVYGSVYVHVPTGEHIHLGNICAEKANLLADRSAFEMERMRMEQATLAQANRARNDALRAAFQAKYPWLAAALALSTAGKDAGLTEWEAAFVHSAARQFVDRCSLSDAQLKILREIPQRIAQRTSRPAETLVPADIRPGRQMVEGVLISIRDQETNYGTVWRMTVKCRTAAGGSWLVWGTFPLSLGDAEVGDTVSFEAALSPGREPHFAVCHRPTKGRVIKQEVKP